MAAKKFKHGGPREGAGRPVGSGTGPSKDARVKRIAVMFSNAELKVLKAHAKRKKLPVATAAYQLLIGPLKRTARK